MPTDVLAPASPTRIAWWRNERVLRVLAQTVFLLALVALAAALYANVQRELQARGIAGGFGFLRMEAGFPIAEGIEYTEGDPYWYAFSVGAVNTLRLALIGIVLATVLGIVAGIARLSGNWLLRTLAGGYVETVRNVPLLVLLVFWYFAVILQLPPVRESVTVFGSVFLSQRGTALPWLVAGDGVGPWLAFVAAGVVAALFLIRWRRRVQERTGARGRGLLWALGAVAGLAALGWLVVPGRPLHVEVPDMGGFNYEGGVNLTPEFTAMIIGLSVYTGAFIAEIVRAGIQAVQQGQKEAARALGLAPGLTLRLVVLPQALRIIIPPMISQYLNLTKNSSLAIAVGFPDLFAISQTIFNQTGKAVEVIAMVMASYLVMSLFTSLVLNLYNRRLRLAER